MTDFLENWANESNENAELVAQELLITEVTEAIWGDYQAANVDLYILGQVATRIFGPNAFLGDGPWCAWSRTLNL